MPNILLNNTLTSLSSGVSQQYEEGRFDSQVDEMINCIPSLTRGVLRRNPLQAIRKINEIDGTNTAILDYFVYTYDRGTNDEQYMIIVDNAGNMDVINTNTGLVVYHTNNSYLRLPAGNKPRDSFKAITIGDHTFIVNKTKKTGYTSARTSINLYHTAGFYWIKKTTSVVKEQSQREINGEIKSGSYAEGYTYRINDAKLTAYLDTRPTTSVSSNTSIANYSSYLSIKDRYPGLTFAGYMVNPSKYYTQSTTPSRKKSLITAFEIAEALATGHYSRQSYCNQHEEAFAFNTNVTGNPSWEWSDTFGNGASLGVLDKINDADKLPARMPKALNYFKVKVTGGSLLNEDDFYLEYRDDIKSWSEIAEPGSKYHLNPSTMPHVLYRLPNGNFKFDTYQELDNNNYPNGKSAWADRKTGSDSDLVNPSFLNTYIKDIFFFRNRLSFLTDDSIVMSRSGDYGNFFTQSIRTVFDDDPIDIKIASTDVTILRKAVPSSGQLLIFSDKNQYILRANDGALTSSTAEVSEISSYTYNKNMEAKAVGNRVFFSNTAGKSTKLFEYQLNLTQVSSANPLSTHLTTYIDNKVIKLIGHDVLGHNFILSDKDRTELKVLTSVVKGDTVLQNAFHKWKFAEKIADIFIIKNDLYVFTETKNLMKIVLDIPDDIRNIEYLDEYPDGTCFDNSRCSEDSCNDNMTIDSYCWDTGYCAGVTCDEPLGLRILANPEGNTVIPTDPNYEYNFDIDWGDGTKEHYSGFNPNPAHEYNVNYEGETFDIQISGDFPALLDSYTTEAKESKSLFVAVLNWGSVKWKTLKNAFNGTEVIEIYDNKSPNLSKCISLERMFMYCDIVNMNLSYELIFDAPIATSVNEMFWTTNFFNVNKITLNIPELIDAESLFNSAIFEEDEEYIGTSEINIMSTDKLTNLGRLFYGSNYGGSINIDNTENVWNYERAFDNAYNFNSSVNFSFRNATDCSNMFYNASNFNQPLNLLFFKDCNLYQFLATNKPTPSYNQNITINAASVSTMEGFISGQKNFNSSIEINCGYALKNLNNFAYNCINYNSTIDINTPNGVISAKQMFENCISFNKPINFDLSNVENTSSMFKGCSSFNQPINFSSTKATNTGFMFYNATSYAQGYPFSTVNKPSLAWYMFANTAINTSELGDLDYSIGSSINLTSYIDSTNMSPANYSKLLIAVDNGGVSNETLGAAGIKYDSSGQAARDSLIAKGWTINDAGLA